jgi:hypothetical protein
VAYGLECLCPCPLIRDGTGDGQHLGIGRRLLRGWQLESKSLEHSCSPFLIGYGASDGQRLSIDCRLL